MQFRFDQKNKWTLDACNWLAFHKLLLIRSTCIRARAMRKSRILDLLVSAENVSVAHNSNDGIESNGPDKSRILDMLVSAESVSVARDSNDSNYGIESNCPESFRGRPKTPMVSKDRNSNHFAIERKSISSRSPQSSIVTSSSQVRLRMVDLLSVDAPMLSQEQSVFKQSAPQTVPTLDSRDAAGLKRDSARAKIPSTMKMSPTFARNIDFLDISHLNYSQPRASPPVARSLDNQPQSDNIFPRLYVVPDPENAATHLTPSQRIATSSSIYDVVKSPFESLAAELDILVIQEDMGLSVPSKSDSAHSSFQSHQIETMSRDLEQARAHIRTLETSQDMTMTHYRDRIEQMRGVISKLEIEKGGALNQAAAQTRLLSTAQNDLERAQAHIKSIESSQQDALLLSKLSRASMHQLQEEISRLDLDRQVMQEEIGRLESEKKDASANSASQYEAVAKARRDLEQAQDQLRTLTSSQAHTEAQFRAKINQMQEVISRLEVEKRVALAHAVSQARLISTAQNDLEQAQVQIKSIESSQQDATSRFAASIHQLQEEIGRSKLESQVLQQHVSKLEAEHTNASINAVSQARLIATLEQACTHIRDVGSDQELITKVRESLQQMQEDISVLELEKRNALMQVTSQATLIATAQSDLEQAQLRISELENQQRSTVADSNAIEQMQKDVSRLQLEKDIALADLERIRVESAAKELKSYARFYATQRLSLQTQASKIGKCQVQNFSLHVDSEHTPTTRPLKTTRYRTQGILSEIGIRSRRQCHALSLFFPVDSRSHQYFILTYFMIAWAQFVTASKFHRQTTSIQVFRVRNRSTYFILKIRRKILVTKVFTIWKANSAYTKC